MHSTNGIALLLIGAALLAGYLAHVVGARAHIPRVTLMLILGVVCGPDVLNIVSPNVSESFPLIAQLALAVVAFLLGAEFVHQKSRHSRQTIGLALVITLVTGVVVAGVCFAVGASVELALVLGSIATATAPAATLDVVREVRAEGPLTDTLLGIVAADDIFGIALFSIALAIAESLAGNTPPTSALLLGGWEILGAAALGIGLGFPMAWLTGRLRPGEPAALEVFGFVILAAGLASVLGVSFLLAGMALGGTVAHRAKHYTRAVHEIEGLSDGLMALFFLLAGFGLDVSALPTLGVLGIAYVSSRVVGRLVGSSIATAAMQAPPPLGHHIGWCLMPQAGVALGLALLATERLPAMADSLLPLVIGATVVFELVGPVLTRWRLGRAGEISEPPAQ